VPNPKQYKDKSKFMGDCMHQNLKVEDKSQDQAVAVCLNMWRERRKKRGKGNRKKSAGEFLMDAALALMDSGKEIQG